MAERPEDLNLPLAVVSRIVKESLPDDINVSKEARQAISKAASVFVLYATSCANNFALKGKRKTLAANDIFQAMGEMEFERFVPELKKSWEAFTTEKQAKLEKKKQQKESKENQDSEKGSEAAVEKDGEALVEKPSEYSDKDGEKSAKTAVEVEKADAVPEDKCEEEESATTNGEVTAS